MVTVQCFKSCGVYSCGFKSHGQNPNHKPTANSAVHLSEVSQWVLRGSSEGTSGNAIGLHQLNSFLHTDSKAKNCINIRDMKIANVDFRGRTLRL